MAVKKEKIESKASRQQKDYLLHLVLFVLGICAGLLYYRVFLVDYYR